MDDHVDDSAVRFLGQAIHNLTDKLNRIENMVLSADAKLGSLYVQLGNLDRIAQRLDARIEQALLTPEQKAEQLEKARAIVEKMKKEAEAEIEMELKRRSERGIAKDGDALTPAERAAWESGHELPQ